MEISIKYFGMIAESIGKTEERLVLKPDAGNDLIAYFKNKYPTIENINFQIAINQEINNSVSDMSTVTEIALLPPFAGG